MPANILIVQGHPDPAGGHLCNALGGAYAEGAEAAGNPVRRIDLARCDFPILRSQIEFEKGPLPATLETARQDLVWAQHVVLIFPLWLGAMPALVKAFLEQILRPGIAFAYQDKGLPKKLLGGRSARVVVTMGMPAFAYRWLFFSHAIRALNRNVLGFVGFGPIRTTFFGMVENASTQKRRSWLARMRDYGRTAK
jgi:putative NADPH-quinone reductase